MTPLGAEPIDNNREHLLTHTWVGTIGRAGRGR